MAAKCSSIPQVVKDRALRTPFTEILGLVAPDLLSQLVGLSPSGVVDQLAGTPLEGPAAGRKGAEHREYAAMSWWLFNRCNSGSDVESLCEEAQRLVWVNLCIQEFWDKSIKYSTLEAILRQWHAKRGEQPSTSHWVSPPPQLQAGPLISVAASPSPVPPQPVDDTAEVLVRASMQAWTHGAQPVVLNWWGGSSPKKSRTSMAPLPKSTNCRARARIRRLLARARAPTRASASEYLGRAQLGNGFTDGESAIAPLITGGYAAAYAMASRTADLSPGLGFREGVVSNILAQLQQQVMLYCDPISLMTPEMQERLKAQRKAEPAEARSATPRLRRFPGYRRSCWPWGRRWTCSFLALSVGGPWWRTPLRT